MRDKMHTSDQKLNAKGKLLYYTLILSYQACFIIVVLMNAKTLKKQAKNEAMEGAFGATMMFPVIGLLPYGLCYRAFIHIQKISSIEDRNLCVGVLSIFALVIALVQFLCITYFPTQVTVLFGILSSLILSFCLAQTFRLEALYDHFDVYHVVDYGYFKFVTSASVCTEYYLHGYGTPFWIILSSSMLFTFLDGNLVYPSDVPPNPTDVPPNLRDVPHVPEQSI
ncbi:hypothetical protein RND81_10G106700 [Saponaria officinalis]|uniref:Uncharacterized protein n=1 Tax=Saponaria officinalis TaxID=3572 RepID=A0AAW1I330_SAPOF